MKKKFVSKCSFYFRRQCAKYPGVSSTAIGVCKVELAVVVLHDPRRDIQRVP